ncbi:DNA methyltransferase [Metamycoplasma hominis]|uniref:DNA methyltransferase n=1 Tax=Metamycoplasma hominis TaxID=2098 RepID=UPI003CF2971A
MSEKDDVAASKFIYRDKFSRTGWLNMMNERLKMARQLLKEDGVIFVSIDDNEQAYLKVLMDEIFGEENFVTNFIWQKKSGGGLNTYIYEGHECILTYALNKNNLKGKLFFNKEITSKKIEKDEKGTFYWEKDWLRKGFGKKEEKDQHRNIFYEELHLYKDENEINEIKNKIDSGEYKLVLNKEYNKNLIARKEYVSENLIKKVVPYTLITQNQGVDLSGVGFDELYSIILMPKNDEEKFKTVKPLTLIKLLVDIKNNKNVRILDFFAGSGTTAHAVMELNRKDGGNRTFTLVTNNENNIGIDVCYERLYRINNGKGSKGETDFDWIKKNEPYNQNLDVFKIKYYDTDAFDNNNEIIKQDFKNMLNDFDLSNVNKINEQEILLNLTALKPIEGKDSNESN